MSQKDKVQLTIRMEPEQAVWVDKVADELRMTKGDIVRLCIEGEMKAVAGGVARMMFTILGRWEAAGLPPLAWFEEIDARARAEEEQRV